MPKPNFIPSLVILFLVSACGDFRIPTYDGPKRAFTSSFESTNDFAGFYLVPQGEYASRHELSTEQVKDGSFSHKAWIVGARAEHNDGEYRPHRAYPTIQLQKTASGVYRTPCLVSLWVWLDLTLASRGPGKIEDWFSFITLTPDASDQWVRTVLLNLPLDGWARLVHVPVQGAQQYRYQVDASSDPGGALKFPMRHWVRFDLYVDFDRTRGFAKAWQNGRLVSHARVEGGVGALAQAHFGLYAAAALSNGVVFNDKLRIQEVSGESEAQTLIDGSW
jgi:hypothetical protein